MKNTVEITKGPIGKNLLWFTIPVILTGFLQLCYHMADVIVVGRFAGTQSLAAVGSTGSLSNLFLTFFMGLSTGASVCVANFMGAGKKKALSKSVHTAIGVAIAGGLLIAISGILLTRKILILMDVPANVLEEAVRYMRIVFLGMPFNLVLNFGAGILRALGDSKHPLIFLSISGVVNVIMNLVLVICFHMGAEGVGIATVISQMLSAVLILYFLATKNPSCKLYFKKIRIHIQYLSKILRLGIPAGIQGIIFSFSNVLIQSSINGFGDVAVAGDAAAASIGNLSYMAMNGVYHAMITFVGQNVGAGNMKRVKKIIFTGCFQVTVIGIVTCFLALLAGKPLVSLYVPGDEQVIQYGMLRLWYILPSYFLCGLMECVVGAQRGMGTSLMPMIASIIGVCGIRIVWIFTLFAAFRTLPVLYLSYSASWLVTASIQAILCAYVYRKIKQNRYENGRV